MLLTKERRLERRNSLGEKNRIPIPETDYLDTIDALESELSEAKARQAVLMAQLDTHVKLVAGMQSELAEARAGCAALLEKAAAHFTGDTWIDSGKGSSPQEIADEIRALIPTDAAAALAEEKRKARIEELERAQKDAWLGYANYFINRLAELRKDQ